MGQGEGKEIEHGRGKRERWELREGARGREERGGGQKGGRSIGLADDRAENPVYSCRCLPRLLFLV